MSEERVKPRSLFVDEAIALALESRWAEALAVNQALVERHGPDEDTLNRIGKALTELGQREEALASYSSSLQLNPLNLIAQNNHGILAAVTRAGYPHLTNVLYVWNPARRTARATARSPTRPRSLGR